MKRLFATILSAVLMTALAFAQNDTVRISGRVTDAGGEPLEACIVTVLAPQDSAIVSYSMTDEAGRYCAVFQRTTDEVLLRLTGFNVKRQVQRVAARNQAIDLRAEEESIALREVQVKAQRLWGSRDTLNYLVSAYMREHDRTIGDVLKQLPGITIDDGVIKYQGTPINHFYIENMDVLQGRYNLATDGIRAEDVATVQVLENHEHVKALQDQVPPESAAINLKLKKKAKGVWTKSANLGFGWDDALLWDNDLNLMHFGRNRQHILYYDNENTGHSGDRAARHYGGSGLGATVLTGILSPGSSPVGTTLRNNRHSVNANNLAKLGETKQLHYNLAYRHDIQRRNSFEQTTYILPEGGLRIMAEEISARHTTNDATAQLIYENNAEKRYVHNSLELAGSWTGAAGAVASNDAEIHQRANNRNLGLQNSTRWVHRTERGGGFEMRSTNSVQTTPQSLDVSGAMDARQDVEMTRASSANSFSLVKDLRKNRWTIVPTSSFNINYVGLESILRATLSDEGTMSYLNAQASLGASLRYVKNEFRMSFNLPLSLNYTYVRNSNEEGIQKTPSLSGRVGGGLNLLWKASDNWTLSANADYGTTQTPWTQLITTYIMQDYRTLNRYVASLNDSHLASTSAKLNYKSILSEFFACLQGGYSRSWSDIVLGTTIDENAHTILQAERMPHHSDTYNLTANASKGFDWHAAKLEATASWRRTDSQTLRQGVKTDFRSDNYSISGNAAANIAKPVRLNYGCTWSKTITSSPSLSGRAGEGLIETFTQNATLNLTLLPSRLLFAATARHTHNSGFNGKKDYAFADASLTYKTRKKHEFILSIDNIFNTRTFISRSNFDLTEYYTLYHLRPRSIMLKTHLNL